MNQTKIHNIKLYAISLLALLLLIAPCSVRNQLETSLGLTTTKPLNPAKSSITQNAFCTIWKNTSEKQNAPTLKKQAELKIPIVRSANFVSVSDNIKARHLVITKGFNWNPPYYILYKRLKIFDLNDAQIV